MADRKITELTALTGANANDSDVFPIVDVSADETKKMTLGELKEAFDSGSGFVRITGDTMTGDLTVPNVIVSGNVDGRDVSVDGTKLDGIEAGADVTETGADFTGNVTFAGNTSYGDNDKAIFGAGSDLQIYSDGTTGQITGDVNLTGTLTSDGLTVDGNVGIGTSSPSAALQVAGTTNGLQSVFGLDSSGLKISTFQKTGNDAGVILDAQESSNGTLTFATTGTERMRIDSSGNVGIGTDSPSALLDLKHNSASTHLRLTEETSGNWSALGVDTSDNLRVYVNNSEAMRIDSGGNVGIGVVPVPSWDTFTALQIEGSSLGALGDNNTILGSNIYHESNAFKYIGSAAATVYQQRLGEHRWSGAASGTAGNTANMTQHMTIDSSGNLLVGTTTIISPNPGHSFSVGSGAQQAIGHYGSSSGTYYSYYSYNGSVIGSITQSGTTSVAYNTSSDYRLKTDAQPMTGASARVQALNPVNFEWLSNGSRVDGFLAHEAQAVVPEAVTGTKDAMRDEEYEVTPAVLDDDGNEVTPAVMGTRSVPDYQGIDQSKLVPLLTAALQEALTKIDDLETRLTALEG